MRRRTEGPPIEKEFVLLFNCVDYIQISYCFLIKNFKKFLTAAHRAAAPGARRKSMDNITGGFAAGAAYAAPIKQLDCFIDDCYSISSLLIF